MIGVLVLVCSLGLLMLVSLSDRLEKQTHRSWVLRLGRAPGKSRYAHYTSYGALITLTWFSFYESAVELGSFVVFFQTYLEQIAFVHWFMAWLLVMAGLLELNVWRFAPAESPEDTLKDMIRVMEETVDKFSSPSKGIEHVLSTVKAHSDEWDPRTVDSFLEHLAGRKDETGAEARRRLEQIKKEREST